MDKSPPTGADFIEVAPGIYEASITLDTPGLQRFDILTESSILSPEGWEWVRRRLRKHDEHPT